ncbi:MAG: GFA family protein, partial [Halieaceae bacterium]|nr:GFA family protein [Halieaceae bacterium]
EGETAAYTKAADSGNTISRVFCPRCGTPLWWTGQGFPNLVVLTLSSLDEPDAFSPSRELWTDSAVSWCRIREGIEQFTGRPGDN